jgi:pyruvate dehydrogenase E2 component (dihydrolipoamide acetyltransferase)
MATPVLLPKLGNSVESSIIVTWLKQSGDVVAEGDPLCAVETDKATVEVPSPVAGVLLKQLANAGDDVPVQTPIALIGAAGESLDTPVPSKRVVAQDTATKAISPRALKMAQQNGVELNAIAGSGPHGRIIERDVLNALAQHAPAAEATAEVAARENITPVAKAMLEQGGYVAPAQGSGPGGRITKHDLIPVDEKESGRSDPSNTDSDSAFTVIPLPNIRRVIAERMRGSLQSTAQLTMNASADARALLDYRKRLKASDATIGLQNITIGDLILFVVAKTLPQFPALNATFASGELRQYKRVHLGFAVDAPRGLLVPVVRDAGALTLKQLADETSRLAKRCQEGKSTPDEMSAGTFTVTNLGSYGIESFTPILNAPQVAILGAGNINLRPVAQNGEVAFVPYLGLSLTIDHQIVDGAPAAKFLQALTRNLAQFDLLLAM